MDRNTRKAMGVKKIQLPFLDDILDWCDSFVFSLFIIILVFMFVFRLVLVDGRSMYPTLSNQDRIVITHIFGSPKQGDIIVLNSDVLGKTIIKRVIGVAGQTVEIDYKNDTVTVDGKKLDESYLQGSALDMRELNNFDQRYYDPQSGTYKYTVPEGYVFVLGDNRNDSTDGRAIGFVPLDCILGKAVLRIFPFKSIGIIK